MTGGSPVPDQLEGPSVILNMLCNKPPTTISCFFLLYHLLLSFHITWLTNKGDLGCRLEYLKLGWRKRNKKNNNRETSSRLMRIPDVSKVFRQTRRELRFTSVCGVLSINLPRHFCLWWPLCFDTITYWVCYQQPSATLSTHHKHRVVATSTSWKGHHQQQLICI